MANEQLRVIVKLIIFVFFAVLFKYFTDQEVYAYLPPSYDDQLLRDSDHSLINVKIIDGKGILKGPESISFHENGILCTGNVASPQGDITCYNEATNKWNLIAKTGGSPLGMRQDPKNEKALYVVDILKGILHITREGKVSTIVDHIGLDDMDISSDGKIFYSLATKRPMPQRSDGSHDPGKGSHDDIIKAIPTGELVSFNPSTNETKTLIKHILFANGVVVSHKEDYVLVACTGEYKILRYWLKGSKAGTYDIFAENLPGFPDGMKRSSDGGYWVSLFVNRNTLLDMVHPYPFIKKLLLCVPEELIPMGYSIIAKLNEEGKITEYYQDLKKEFGPFTSAIEHDGKLYLGTLHRETISVFTLPPRKS